MSETYFYHSVHRKLIEVRSGDTRLVLKCEDISGCLSSEMYNEKMQLIPATMLYIRGGQTITIPFPFEEVRPAVRGY